MGRQAWRKCFDVKKSSLDLELEMYLGTFLLQRCAPNVGASHLLDDLVSTVLFFPTSNDEHMQSNSKGFCPLRIKP